MYSGTTAGASSPVRFGGSFGGSAKEHVDLLPRVNAEPWRQPAKDDHGVLQACGTYQPGKARSASLVSRLYRYTTIT